MMTNDAARFHSLPYDRGEVFLDLEFDEPGSWGEWADEFRYELGPEPPSEADMEAMAEYCRLRDQLDQMNAITDRDTRVDPWSDLR
jgi:hypothetical protein